MKVRVPAVLAASLSAVAFPAVLLAPLLAPAAAAAQLLGDRVVGEQRLCVYVGSDRLPDGNEARRSTVVPSSQPCPDVAPYRDPNRRPPGNAALLRQTAENGRRVCVYGQGGVEYERATPPSGGCPATPDLLDRALAARDPAAPFAR